MKNSVFELLIDETRLDGLVESLADFPDCGGSIRIYHIFEELPGERIFIQCKRDDPIFVDTWGWIALGHRKNPRHCEVKGFYQEMRKDCKEHCTVRIYNILARIIKHSCACIKVGREGNKHCVWYPFP